MNYKIDILPAFTDNYIFLLTCTISNKTICIDPADGKIVLDKIKKDNLNLVAIFNTHHHPDHIGGNKYLKEQTNCQIYGFAEDKYRISSITNELEHNSEIKIGNLHFIIKHTPGHTNGHIIYFETQHNLLFAGDVIFSSGCGYLFEGSYEEMYNSLEEIKKLPDSTQIYCAHEYTLNNISFAETLEPNNQALLQKKEKSLALRKANKPTIPTNLKTEKETNPFLRSLSRELRQNIGTTSLAYNVDVFKKTRKLKDKY